MLAVKAQQSSAKSPIEALRRTHLFGDGPVGAVQKQLVFLAVVDAKPASIAVLDVSERTGNMFRPDTPEIQQLAALMASLHLEWTVTRDRYGVEVCVARDEAALQAALTASNEGALGRALGFPESAVDAWENDRLLPHAAEAELYVREGVDGQTDFFRLSQDHHHAELKLLRDWWRLLEENDLA